MDTRGEVSHDVVSVTAELDLTIGLVKLVELVFDLFAPVQVLHRDLPILVHVVNLHELHDAVSSVQVHQVLVLVIGHQMTVHCQESHLFVSLFVDIFQKSVVSSQMLLYLILQILF